MTNLVNINEQIGVRENNTFRLFKEAFIDKFPFFQSCRLLLTEIIARKKVIEDLIIWSNNNTFNVLLLYNFLSLDIELRLLKIKTALHILRVVRDK